MALIKDVKQGKFWSQAQSRQAFMSLWGNFDQKSRISDFLDQSIIMVFSVKKVYIY